MLAHANATSSYDIPANLRAEAPPHLLLQEFHLFPPTIPSSARAESVDPTYSGQTRTGDIHTTVERA